MYSYYLSGGVGSALRPTSPTATVGKNIFLMYPLVADIRVTGVNWSLIYHRRLKAGWHSGQVDNKLKLPNDLT